MNTLPRKTGLELARYEDQLAAQGGACAICGRKPKPGGRSLHRDHSHEIAGRKIKSAKAGKTWSVSFETQWGSYIVTGFRTKSEGLEKARYTLLHCSRRGLICWPCNAGLQKWRDSPDLLEAAAAYLRKYQPTAAAVKQLEST